MNSSQNLPPANLCYHPTSSDLLSLRLSEVSRTSSQPPKLSQLHKRLGSLGATFQPSFSWIICTLGEQNISWTFVFCLHLDLSDSCYSCSEPSFVFFDRSLKDQYNTDATCSISFISCRVLHCILSLRMRLQKTFVPVPVGLQTCVTGVPDPEDPGIICLLNHVYAHLDKPVSSVSWMLDYVTGRPEGQLWWTTLSLGLSRIIDSERKWWWI